MSKSRRLNFQFSLISRDCRCPLNWCRLVVEEDADDAKREKKYNK